MFTALSLATVRPPLLDKCKAFSALSTSYWPVLVQWLSLPLSEDWEVSIYGRMIQHQCNILTGECGVVFSRVLQIIALSILDHWNAGWGQPWVNLRALLLTWLGELNWGHPHGWHKFKLRPLTFMVIIFQEIKCWNKSIWSIGQSVKRCCCWNCKFSSSFIPKTVHMDFFWRQAPRCIVNC